VGDVATARDIGVLGPLALGADGAVLGAKQSRLLAGLALEANRAVSADRLAVVLWGKDSAGGASATLHSHVSRLRRHLEQAGSGARVVTAGSGYRLEVETDGLDALAFEDLLRAGELRAALALWRGPAYADLADDDTAQAEAARLHALRLAAQEDLIDALIAQGRLAEALADLETLVRQHPYRDRLWAALILARYRAGRQAEALEAFQTYRRTLDTELGLEPSAVLLELQQRVLSHDPGLMPAAAEQQPAVMPPAEEPVAELKLVTVLLAGQRLEAHADPEDLAEAAEPVLTRLVEVVHQYGGTVLSARPSGVLAVFGAPAAAEDHALRACLAAEQMRSGLVAVAIESGEVLLRDVRSDSSHGYDAVGAPVEQTRRAQQLAPVGGVLVGPVAHRLVEGLVLSSRAEEPWRLLDEVVSTTAWDARAQRGLSSLVGRDDELGLLLDLAEQAAISGGRVAGLVGDPGVGKSRLAYELTTRVPPGWSVLTVAASPLDVAVPFQPLVPVLRELPEVPALAALLARPVEPEWQRLDPGVQRRRTITAIAELLLSQADAGPLLLLVEDAHWLDGETLAVLDVLVDRISSAAVLLVVTYRPEHDPGWANRSQFTLVRVDPLQSRHSAELAAVLLGDDPSVQALRAQLAGWTGGVPLFLEESVRELRETGTLSGQHGGYVLEQSAEPLRLPPRVHGVLAARIDRLPAQQKRLLQAASVVGAEGDLSLLAAVLGTGREQVEDDLPGLHRADLLYERRHRSERRFVFKHALVHDTAYASLPRSQRRALHGRAVDALDSPDQDDALERMAHHALHAERWAQAADLNRRAGERALQACAYREAIALLTKSLEAQRRLPPDPDREIDLLVSLRPALHATSQFDEAQAHLLRAEELAATRDRHGQLVRIVLHRCYVLHTRGHMAAALEANDRALALALEGDEPLLVAEARLALGQCRTMAGDPRPAVEALTPDMAARIAAPFERLGMAGTRPLFAWSLLAMSQAMLGDFDQADRSAAEAEAVAAMVQRPIDSVVAAWARGALELQRDRPDLALPVLRSAFALCADSGLPLMSRWITPPLAEALIAAGEHDEARALLTDMLSAGVAAKVPLWQAHAHLGLARLGTDATSHAQQAISLSEQWGYPLWGVIGRRLLAEATGSAAVAQEALHEAERIGAKPEQARLVALIASLVLEPATD
jgi:DNA-binding SARP family transcriptional activator